jgi:serine/threonine protein phosphatase PrpC
MRNLSLGLAKEGSPVDYAQITKPGSRDYNEDSAVVLENDRGSLFVVADGLGGHGRGEVASALVTDTFKKHFENDIADVTAFISETMLAAQANLLKEQKTKSASFEMKTTCVALLITNGTCQMGHVGDTRAYVFQNNKIKTRTLDHSVPQMLVMSGEIKEKHIRNHPDRNRLLRVMGIDWDSPRYDLSEDIPLSECQAFLLCTDGFWELCDEKKMCAFLKKSGNASEWLRLMTEEVEKNGQGIDMDNFTAITVVC